MSHCDLLRSQSDSSGQRGVEESAQSSNLVLAGPAEGQAVVLFLAFFLCLNDSILLNLYEAVLRVPWPQAAKHHAC